MKFNPLYVRLAELIEEGSISEVRSVHASFGVPYPHDDSCWWKAEMGGGSLLDQGIYPVTRAHMILGTPEGIHAEGLIRDGGVDLSEHFTLTYPNGRYARGASSMVDFLDLTGSICHTTGGSQPIRVFGRLRR